MKADAFQVLSGKMRTFERNGEGGHKVRTPRCSGCGTWVWAEHDARPDFRAVLAPTLDDPPAYVSQMSPWVALDPELTQFQRMPEEERASLR
ncbi:GFA family protein [Candidatus Viadribacter manganicus]|uniref:GFA family protein n=1 Tax=Candidatus Viadribacter manganicus TaxID=1759059 RepID=UPI001E2F041B